MATPSFYRERADQAQRDADNASLSNVRERHLVAREKNEAEKAAVAAANTVSHAN